MNKIKNILENNKKKLVVVVLLLLAIALSTGYILTNKRTDVKPTSNKTSEVTTKEDNKNTVKSDTKKEDKKDNKQEVKEDKKSDEKKSDTKVEETSNTESNTTSIATETTNNNVSNTTSNNTSNNTSYTQPTSAPCVPTYTTVNHPEQGHYEQTLVMPAYDEPVYEMRMVGGQTGRIYNNTAEFANQEEDFSYAIKQVQVDTIHHDAEYNQVWVVDQQAWTETVASGC